MGVTSELAYPKECPSNGVMLNLKYFHSNAWEHLALGLHAGYKGDRENRSHTNSCMVLLGRKPLLYKESLPEWSDLELALIELCSPVCLIPSGLSLLSDYEEVRGHL